MTVPYSAAFALLSITQGFLVMPGMRHRRVGAQFGWLGVAIPLGLFAAGLLLVRSAEWSTNGLANTATFLVPFLAAIVGWTRGWRPPFLLPPLVVAIFLVAWRADGITADIAALVLICGSCLSVAALIAWVTPPRAVAVGLVVLAIVDTVLVFTNQVAPVTDALREVVPVDVGGRPLPSLQDATVDGALMGWLDLLAPALAGTLLAGMTRPRLLAGVAVGIAALAWGLLFHVSDHLPGTVPPLVAVAVWVLVSGRTRLNGTPHTGSGRVSA